MLLSVRRLQLVLVFLLKTEKEKKISLLSECIAKCGLCGLCTWAWASLRGVATFRIKGFSSLSCLPMQASLKDAPRRLSLRGGGVGGVLSRS